MNYQTVLQCAHEKLSQGAPFEMTVRDCFEEDRRLMRQFARECSLQDVRTSFEKNPHWKFTPLMLAFLDNVDDMCRLTRNPEKPYIRVDQKLMNEMSVLLRDTLLMQENGAYASALLIEERILTEYVPRMARMEDRNRVRSMLYAAL